MIKRYQEPVGLPEYALLEDDRRERVDAAFECFKAVCESVDGPIGTALRSKFDEVYPDFAQIWRDYDTGRQHESRALRVSTKPQFQALEKQAGSLRKLLHSEDRNFRRYLIRGLARRMSPSSPQEASAFLDVLADNLDLVIGVCSSEVKLKHSTGAREDATLSRACSSMRLLVQRHTSISIPKSLKHVKTDGFENGSVQILYELLQSVDERLTASQVRFALQKLPPMPKA